MSAGALERCPIYSAAERVNSTTGTRSRLRRANRTRSKRPTHRIPNPFILQT